MKKISLLCKRIFSIKIINFIAIKAAGQTVNSACAWVWHQPEVPDEVKALKKF